MNVLITIYVFLFGLIIGSFLNCLAWRLYKEESILGRSYCPKCGKQIAWYDNIPLLSFLILRGKCRQCGQGISWQYPIVEFVTGLLFVVAFVNLFSPNFQFPISNFQLNSNDQFPIINEMPLEYHGADADVSPLDQRAKALELPRAEARAKNVRLFRDLFIISVMVLIFIIDLKWYLIFDVVTLPAAAVVLGLNLWLGHDWQELLISGIIGAGFFLAQYIISRGKWIGGGDIRLGLLMGLALGWPGVLVAILMAYFAGSIIGLSLIGLGKKEWGGMVPLGAFLAPATIAVLFWGEGILAFYWRLIGV